jgi:glutaredoxin 2
MLILYIKDNCGYSQEVMDAVETLGVEVDVRNKSTNPDYEEELQELQGSSEVPYLVDTEKGRNITESQEIIEYLEENYSSSEL